jgi:hypothetical protein
MAPNAILTLIARALTLAGYTPKICTLPAWREWDDPLPLVMVVPDRRPNFRWIMFGKKNCTQSVDLALVNTNDLSVDVPTEVDQFKQDVAKLFMTSVQGNPTFATSDVWQSRVEDQPDFRIDKLPAGYNVSAIRVKMDFVVAN